MVQSLLGGRAKLFSDGKKESRRCKTRRLSVHMQSAYMTASACVGVCFCVCARVSIATRVLGMHVCVYAYL